ncbi:YbjN domain-containing protein [Alkalinema pantanalense CENA528]|uniref:YbjN domain-containing protein n=1 Tax=Alkalinema pantanalense TaxID=1620705 RepID=UPI003D6EDEC3
MSSILEQLISFFQSEKWEFEHIVAHHLLRFEVEGTQGEWVCYAKAKEDDHQFIFYSNLPSGVPPEKRSAVAEYITRANNGLILGNFELDFDEGEVHYKTSIEAAPDVLTADLIRPIVYANLSVMDQYLPGFAWIITDNLSPAAAIQQLEESLPED